MLLTIARAARTFGTTPSRLLRSDLHELLLDVHAANLLEQTPDVPPMPLLALAPTPPTADPDPFATLPGALRHL